MAAAAAAGSGAPTPPPPKPTASLLSLALAQAKADAIASASATTVTAKVTGAGASPAIVAAGAAAAAAAMPGPVMTAEGKAPAAAAATTTPVVRHTSHVATHNSNRTKPFVPPSGLEVAAALARASFVCDAIWRDTLYQGNAQAAQDLGLLRALGVTGIVNCAAATVRNAFGSNDGIRYFDIAAEDDDREPISDYFDDACAFIDACLTANGGSGKVLIHCRAGISRSSTVTLAYLMRGTHGPQLSIGDAWRLLSTARPCACPNDGFWTQLMALDTQLTAARERARHESAATAAVPADAAAAAAAVSPATAASAPAGLPAAAAVTGTAATGAAGAQQHT